MNDTERTVLALTGNARCLDIETLITQEIQQFREWVLPLYPSDQLEHLVGVYTTDFMILHSEPKWPKGQIKQHRKKYERWRHKIFHLQSLRHNLIGLGYPEYNEDDDYDYTYQLETVWITRVKKP